MSVTQVTVLLVEALDSGVEFKDDSFWFVDEWYPHSVNLVFAQILHEADGRGIEARLLVSLSLLRGGAIIRDEIEIY